MGALILLALIFFSMEGSSATTDSAGNPGTNYTVMSGDSLSAIAGRFWGSQYNSYQGAQVIATANQNYFGNGQDQDEIQPGWVLFIPASPT